MSCWKVSMVVPVGPWRHGTMRCAARRWNAAAGTRSAWLRARR